MRSLEICNCNAVANVVANIIAIRICGRKSRFNTVTNGFKSIANKENKENIYIVFPVKHIKLTNNTFFKMSYNQSRYHKQK